MTQKKAKNFIDKMEKRFNYIKQCSLSKDIDVEMFNFNTSEENSQFFDLVKSRKSSFNNEFNNSKK